MTTGKVGALVMILGTLALGITIDILLWPITKAIWSELVHKVVLEQARDPELLNRLVYYTLDGLLAVALMIGIGLGLASACVQTLVNALSRR